MSQKITVETIVNAPIEKIWKYWTEPEHITKWNNASGDWFTPRAENDLRVGGKFTSRMEARDGSSRFDFEGIYTVVEEHKKIEYKMLDGRVVEVRFENEGDRNKVTEIFDSENENPREMQKNGWQAILENFKKYIENN